MAVGGSGGHFSPEYFDYIRIPQFPDNVIDTIAELYCNDSIDIYVGDDLNAALGNDIKKMGIIQLDVTLKALKDKLKGIIDNVINDKKQNVEKIEYETCITTY